ncbi:MAG: chemotaxis protein CheW [Clostridiales Family XIII bacterium]|jgi:purine-binding chemotaxis protein CheW|nr:chemotaxis protein CheW [Clostridiales Family XIII bacterium]
MAENFEEIKEELREEDTLQGRFLTFTLVNDVYGLPIEYVVEIIGIQSITIVPKVPAYIKGIINLRGKIIPVIDVRLKFGKEPAEYNDRTCVIVIEISDTSVGLIVDNVDEVLTIEDDNIAAPPANRMGFENRYIMGIGKIGGRVQLLLDCQKLLLGDEFANMSISDEGE